MLENEHFENEQKSGQYKRKRKKTFLKNAKKYAKKGCYGRGSHLEADTYEYLVRIMEVYNAGFPSEEEKLMFVNNVFDQIETQEMTCSCNQVGCRIIEILLPFANNGTLERFMEAFKSELRPLCSDRFASHVLETMVRVFSKKSIDPEVEEEFRNKCKEYTLKIGKFLLNNLEDYVWDTYGNHIIRTVLESLALLPKEEPKKAYVEVVEADVKIELIEDYQQVINEYAERLLSWPQFKDLPYEDLPSGLLQMLIRALARTNKKLLGKCVKKLLNESFLEATSNADDNEETVKNTDKLPPVFMSNPAMRLLECMIQVARSKNFTQIYAKLFTNNLVKLSAMKSTNFAVQKLLNCSKEKVEFEAMFEEVQDHLSKIIESGNSGVILSLGQGCKRLGTKQGNFMQDLMKALKCNEPQEMQNHFVMSVLKMTPLDPTKMAETTSVEKITLHGSLLVQLMLEYNKPIKVINSLLSMDANLLKELFCNRMGSHIVDSFMKSGPFVGEKSREKLVRKMQGTYRDMAASKHGSRSFEAIWIAATLKHREWIMNELSNKDGAWSNSEFGKIIAGKVNLPLYKRNIEDWKNSLNKSEKTKTMFADILAM